MDLNTFSKDLICWALKNNSDTPTFYYSKHVIHSAIDKLRNQLGMKISFATKSNAHPLVLRELVDKVDAFNVTNLSDLDRLLSFNVAPDRISWIHPVSKKETIQAVLSRGVKQFVVDDMRGWMILCNNKESLKITLRLQPPLSPGAGRSLVRFGTDKNTIIDLAQTIVKSNHELEALSFFIGFAGIGSQDPFSGAIQAIADLYDTLKQQNISVPIINIGGGFPGSQRTFFMENKNFFHDIKTKLNAVFDKNIQFICEPGRYLIEACLLMLSQVITDRQHNDRRFVYLDASAYSGLFETSFIDPDDKLAIGYTHEGALSSAILLGPIMDSFDVIKRDCLLPKLEDGALLVLTNIGAYAIGYSNLAEGLQTPNVIELPDELSSMLCDIWYE